MTTKLYKNKKYFNQANWTVERIQSEVDMGLELLNSIDKKIVTFFGSHRAGPEHEYYKHAERVAYELGKKDYAIMSGGGAGIMHAANSGATRAKTVSVGVRAELLDKKHVKDKIYTNKIEFHFLFVRRFIMSIKSEGLVLYPGGYGTINELFEYLMLMQTGVVDKVPIICVNRKYWEGLFSWLKNNPLGQDFFMRDKKDLELINFVDSLREIEKLIGKK